MCFPDLGGWGAGDRARRRVLRWDAARRSPFSPRAPRARRPAKGLCVLCLRPLPNRDGLGSEPSASCRVDIPSAGLRLRRPSGREVATRANPPKGGDAKPRGYGPGRSRSYAGRVAERTERRRHAFIPASSGSARTPHSAWCILCGRSDRRSVGDRLPGRESARELPGEPTTRHYRPVAASGRRPDSPTVHHPLPRLGARHAGVGDVSRGAAGGEGTPRLPWARHEEGGPRAAPLPTPARSSPTRASPALLPRARRRYRPDHVGRVGGVTIWMLLFSRSKMFLYRSARVRSAPEITVTGCDPRNVFASMIT